MKAKEMKETIYVKLVSLDYSRKENYLSEVNSIDYNSLDGELKEMIESFPVRVIDEDVDLMGIEDLDGEQQFYVFHTEGQAYLVDTQGYTYPRYIVKLDGIEDVTEDPIFERMDGLIRITDEQILTMVVKNLVYDLHGEGFDKEDIEPFLQVLLLRATQNIWGNLQLPRH